MEITNHPKAPTTEEYMKLVSVMGKEEWRTVDKLILWKAHLNEEKALSLNSNDRDTLIHKAAAEALNDIIITFSKVWKYVHKMEEETAIKRVENKKKKQPRAFGSDDEVAKI